MSMDNIVPFSTEAIISQLTFMDEHIIAVDAGKHDIKVISMKGGKIHKVFSFPSKYKTTTNFKATNAIGSKPDKTFRVECKDENGKMTKFMVGHLPDVEYNKDKTKVHFHHQICIYTAIAILTQPGERVTLLTAFPSRDFSSELLVSDFESLLYQEDGHIDFYLNGVHKPFIIDRLGVYTEGMAYFTREKNGIHRAYHIVDIGGQNVNYHRYDEEQSYCVEPYSLDDAGMNHLQTSLLGEIRSATNGGIDMKSTALNLRSMLTYKEISIAKPDAFAHLGFETHEAFIAYYVKDFIEHKIAAGIKQDCDFNILGDKIIFTGGGSILLKPYILEMYPENAHNFIFSDRPREDNGLSLLINYLMDCLGSGEIEEDKANQVYRDIYTAAAGKYFPDAPKYTISELLNTQSISMNH